MKSNSFTITVFAIAIVVAAGIIALAINPGFTGNVVKDCPGLENAFNYVIGCCDISESTPGYIGLSNACDRISNNYESQGCGDLSCGPVCGNGICEQYDEHVLNCPEDCTPVCFDGDCCTQNCCQWALWRTQQTDDCRSMTNFSDCTKSYFIIPNSTIVKHCSWENNRGREMCKSLQICGNPIEERCYKTDLIAQIANSVIIPSFVNTNVSCSQINREDQCDNAVVFYSRYPATGWACSWNNGVCTAEDESCYTSP